MEPKDPVKEGYTPLDLEDDEFIYPENDCDDYYAEDDPYDGYNFLDRDSFLEEEIEDPYEGLDDIFDDLEGLDESDLY